MSLDVLVLPCLLNDIPIDTALIVKTLIFIVITDDIIVICLNHRRRLRHHHHHHWVKISACSLSLNFNPHTPFLANLWV